MKTIYMITWDTYLEAKNKSEAEELLIDDNSNNVHLYYDTFDSDVGALEAFKKTVNEFTRPPKKLSYGLYWFSGAMMEIYRGCPEDLTDITEAPIHATTTDIITFVPDIEE